MSVLQRNLDLLDDGVRLLGSLTPEAYTTAAPDLGLSAAGVHVRHALEFYARFLDGLAHGEVDYDARRREPELEIDPSRARDRMQETRARLAALDPADLASGLRVRQDDVGDHDAAWTESSVPRELQFLAAHLVHHFALVGAILRATGADVPDDFGIAPSTLHHWKTLGARAR